MFSRCPFPFVSEDCERNLNVGLQAMFVYIIDWWVDYSLFSQKIVKMSLISGLQNNVYKKLFYMFDHSFKHTMLICSDINQWKAIYVSICV